MSNIASLAVIFLSAFCYTFLALELGGFILLSRSVRGKFPRRTVPVFERSFVLGILFSAFLILFLIFFLLSIFSPASSDFIPYLCSFLLVLSFLLLFVYYREMNSTEIWLPKSFSRHLSFRARSISRRRDAFLLGILVVLYELPFSLILFVTSAFFLQKLSGIFLAIGLILFLFVLIFPVFLAKSSLKSSFTIAKLQKFRAENNIFFRILASFSFLVLALFLLSCEIGVLL